MISLQEIDRNLRETEVSQRRKYLIMNLGRLGVSETVDGRKLETLGLADLEWMHIEAMNKEAKNH